MRIASILVAAGSGSRFGAETPKQFLPLAGQPVIRHAARALAAHVTLLQPVGDAAAIDAALQGIPHLPTVQGGATRQDSVLAGLIALEPHAPDIVLVHDAARPVIPAGTIPALIEALKNAKGAIPAVPVADTLKRVANSLIQQTVPRAGLYRAMTMFMIAPDCASKHLRDGIIAGLPWRRSAGCPLSPAVRLNGSQGAPRWKVGGAGGATEIV